jgi:hypothetical protein
MNKETLRMQMLAGIITESQYKTKLNESIESLSSYYSNSNKEVKTLAKTLDAMLQTHMGGIGEEYGKILYTITELADEYAMKYNEDAGYY